MNGMYIAACSRGAAVQQHCWPPDLTMSLAAQAVAARYRGAAVQQHCRPPDLTMSLAAPAVAVLADEVLRSWMIVVSTDTVVWYVRRNYVSGIVGRSLMAFLRDKA